MAKQCATCGGELKPPFGGNTCKSCGQVVCRACTITVRTGPSRGTYCRNCAVTVATPIELPTASGPAGRGSGGR